MRSRSTIKPAKNEGPTRCRPTSRVATAASGATHMKLKYSAKNWKRWASFVTRLTRWPDVVCFCFIFAVSDLCEAASGRRRDSVDDGASFYRVQSGRTRKVKLCAERLNVVSDLNYVDGANNTKQGMEGGGHEEARTDFRYMV